MPNPRRITLPLPTMPDRSNLTREQRLELALRDALRLAAQVLDDLEHGAVDVETATLKIAELQRVLDGEAN